MEPFLFQSKKGLPFFSLAPWKKEFPHLQVGFSARKPQEDWSTCNYALHVGDNPAKVIYNRKQLSEALGVSFASWTCGEQVHGVHIEVVHSDQRGKGREVRETAFSDTDGLLTGETDILLTSYYADCVPLFFYSPDLDWVGVAHAGWKGTVAGIGEKMLQNLVELGANLKNIRVAIGPSIGGCCYEVDEKVIQPLRSILQSDELKPTIAKRNNHSKWQLDLKQANAAIFLKNGINPQHLIISSWCTSCDLDYFYSHRRDQGNTGRMVAWIGKKERRSS
ncbi:peptidoglycan editing factor PgeF [Thermoflavimicrobium daqui]|uniref:Purine nucleoside phosphorylase n=1 Tax=Thermoflavimicrobium daqui TaxID=2137476 RepID=A0A364K6V6_9BACL|nr:peptidoglycan editing factor PgeF [Thermoflavimicrobium daqui]RAL26024.1 peptidoglycan editing factor PgeF [Thermoflavimicrobium daqui]